MRRCLIMFAVLLAASGCSAAHMELPRDLSPESVNYQVEGRQGFNIFDERFSFGPYSVVKVDRGWTETTTIGVFSVSNTEAEQTLTFTLRAPSGSWLGRCAANVQRLGWDQSWSGGNELNMDLAGSESYVCEFIPPGSKPWVMAMTGRGADQAMHGNMVLSGTRIDISGSHNLAGTSIDLSDPAGYLFLHMGKTIGAVDVVNQGEVTVPAGKYAEIAEALAAASAALLLRQDLVHQPESTGHANPLPRH